jgi:hypothetical protein
MGPAQIVEIQLVDDGQAPEQLSAQGVQIEGIDCLVAFLGSPGSAS